MYLAHIFALINVTIRLQFTDLCRCRPLRFFSYILGDLCGVYIHVYIYIIMYI